MDSELSPRPERSTGVWSSTRTGSTACTPVGADRPGLRTHRRRPVPLQSAVDHRRDHELRTTFRDARHLLESHFRCRFAPSVCVALVILTSLVSIPMMLVLIGFVFLLIGLGLTGLWVIYRIVRGWLALREGRPMPCRRYDERHMPRAGLRSRSAA